MDRKAERVSSLRHGTKPVIGLIGGIGAGKSTAANCFQRRGGVVVDADIIGHAALQQPEIIARVVERWGKRVQKPDGSLDRREIGRIVFADPKERNTLQELVFPFIGEKCKKEITAALDDPSVPFVVLDAAIMLEAGWNEIADWIVYVDASRALRLARVAERNAWTEKDLTAREAAQWPEEMKKAKSHVILMNSGDTENLQSQVDRFLAHLKSLRER